MAYAHIIAIIALSQFDVGYNKKCWLINNSFLSYKILEYSFQNSQDCAGIILLDDPFWKRLGGADHWYIGVYALSIISTQWR